ncbi:ABC transporter permease [Paenirhodobacter populi]|uniref:ABC transporter permease n=1 Tax=Paenirhodobacter populi TaxID=2306993 RepID=A0A443J4I8_9RHOB|nr:ABC transporter permease [Sinirhodobacter populi]RWR15468.1 ABC transporter permease [Sinirhodobacter populi]
MNRPNIRVSGPLTQAVLGAVALLVAAFLILPVLIIVPVSFTADSFLSFPPPGFSTQWYARVFSRADWLNSAWLSIWIAVVVTVVSTVLGTLGALGLVRGRFIVQRLLLAFILSPLIVPGVIVAIAIYFFYARLKFVGSPLAIAVAHTTLAVPFVVVNVSAALHGFDRRLEMAAANLGAGRFATFFHVTLPIIRPGIAAGALFAFISSFDELIVAMFIAGPTQVTLPLRMWESMKSSLDPSIAAVSVLAIAISVALFLSSALLQRRARRRSGAASGDPQ